MMALHAAPIATENDSTGSSGSESDCSSSSDAGGSLRAPEHPWINIERFFESLGDVGLPHEVAAVFDGDGVPSLSTARRLKWSFN